MRSVFDCVLCDAENILLKKLLTLCSVKHRADIYTPAIERP